MRNVTLQPSSAADTLKYAALGAWEVEKGGFTTVMVDFVCKLAAIMFAIIMALYAFIYYKVNAGK